MGSKAKRRHSIFIDKEQHLRQKEQRLDKIAQFLKKLDQSKKLSLHTSDIIEDIYKNQMHYAGIEANKATSRQLLKKDAYSEKKKEIWNKIMKDEELKQRRLLQRRQKLGDKKSQRSQEGGHHNSPKKSRDILDMVIKKGIKLKLSNKIKDSEYIVKACLTDKNAYLSYKKKNFLRNKDKDQKEIVERLTRVLSHKKQINSPHQPAHHTNQSQLERTKVIEIDSNNSLRYEFSNKNPKDKKMFSQEIKLQEYLGDNDNDQNMMSTTDNQGVIPQPHTAFFSHDYPNSREQKRFDFKINNRPKSIALGTYKNNYQKMVIPRYHFESRGFKVSEINQADTTEASTKHPQRLGSAQNHPPFVTQGIKSVSGFRCISQGQKYRAPNISTNSFQKKPSLRENHAMYLSYQSALQLSNIIKQSSDYGADTNNIGPQSQERPNLYQTFQQNPQMMMSDSGKNLRKIDSRKEDTMESFLNENQISSVRKSGAFMNLRRQVIEKIQNKDNIQERLKATKSAFKSAQSSPTRYMKRPMTQGVNQREKQKIESNRRLLNVIDSDDNLIETTSVNRSTDAIISLGLRKEKSTTQKATTSFHSVISQQLKGMRKMCNTALSNPRIDTQGIKKAYEELKNDSSRDIMDYIPSSNPVAKYEQLLIQEDIKQNRFDEAFEQIQMMDLSSVQRPQTLQQILNYKVQERNEINVDGILVEGEYRQGMNDPSRAAAQWEKVKGIRKVIGRKAIIEDFLKRVKNTRENNYQIVDHS